MKKKYLQLGLLTSLLCSIALIGSLNIIFSQKNDIDFRVAARTVPDDGTIDNS